MGIVVTVPSFANAQEHRPQLSFGGTVAFAGRFDSELSNPRSLGNGGAFDQFELQPFGHADRDIASFNAPPSYGLVLRYEHPVHRFVSFGVATELYRYRRYRPGFGGERDWGWGLSPTVRAGYPFYTRKRKRQIEVYARMQFGFSLSIEAEDGLFADKWQPGFNAALSFDDQPDCLHLSQLASFAKAKFLASPCHGT